MKWLDINKGQWENRTKIFFRLSVGTKKEKTAYHWNDRNRISKRLLEVAFYRAWSCWLQVPDHTEGCHQAEYHYVDTMVKYQRQQPITERTMRYFGCQWASRHEISPFGKVAYNNTHPFWWPERISLICNRNTLLGPKEKWSSHTCYHHRDGP